MATTNKQLALWNGSKKPEVGDLTMDHYSLQVKVFDGTAWLTLPGTDNLQDINLTDLQQMIRNRKNMSDSWIETKYPDLKELRKRYEKEYDTLRDKYKVFEILSLPRVNEDVR